tara:strand:+ start:361 stop:585 length:225 start_codon:yes stop_codon:yes gene_type:complete
LDKKPKAKNNPNRKKNKRFLFCELNIFIIHNAIKDEKNNKGTSVDIKKDENDIPGMNKYKKNPKNDFLKFIVNR